MLVHFLRYKGYLDIIFRLFSITFKDYDKFSLDLPKEKPVDGV